MHLTFVLLPEAAPPSPEDVAEAYESLFEEPLLVGAGEVLTMQDMSGAEAFAVFVGEPIATGEVEAAAASSLATLSGMVAETGHAAHLLVTTPGESTPESRRRHTRIVAAVAVAASAPAIYDGSACATHPTQFYVDLAGAESLPVPLWTGVRIARESPELLWVLSLGMASFELPNLLLKFRREQAEDAVAFLLNTAEYMIERGEAPADGQTIGRSETERYRVEHFPSPLDANELVVKIELTA